MIMEWISQLGPWNWMVLGFALLLGVTIPADQVDRSLLRMLR